MKTRLALGQLGAWAVLALLALWATSYGLLVPSGALAADQSITVTATPQANVEVYSVTPDSAKQNDTVTFGIVGLSFTGATDVSFGLGVTTDSFTVIDDTHISGTISILWNATLGARDVSVTSPMGTGTKTGGFTVLDGYIIDHEEAIGAHDETLDWQAETSTVIVVAGTSTIESTLYSENPAGPVPKTGIQYYDVRAQDPGTLTSLTVDLYYSSSLSGITPYWWNGASWIECSNYTVYPTYVRVYIDDTTSPTLAQMQGTHITLVGGVAGVYYLVAVLPFVYGAISLLAVLGFMAGGYYISGVVLAAILSIIGIVGIGVIQQAITAAFQ